MNEFPDLASALIFTATLAIGTFSVEQDLDGSVIVTTGLVPANTVPQTLTAYQAKAALSLAGLFAAVNTYMTTTALEIDQIAWANAQSFNRTDPIIVNMMPVLSLTATQVDQLFITGFALQP